MYENSIDTANKILLEKQLGGMTMKKTDESTYERIMQSAAKQFALKGYEGTTTRQIVADAGASLSSLQFHFQSKASLYQAVIERTSELFYTLNAKVINEIDEVEHQGLLDVDGAWDLLVQLTGQVVEWVFVDKYKYEILLINRELLQSGNSKEKIPDSVFALYRYYQKLFDVYIGNRNSMWTKALSFSIVTSLFDYANYPGTLSQILGIDVSLDENKSKVKIYLKKYLMISMRASLNSLRQEDTE